jgi:hypothetical protein
MNYLPIYWWFFFFFFFWWIFVWDGVSGWQHYGINLECTDTTA